MASARTARTFLRGPSSLRSRAISQTIRLSSTASSSSSSSSSSNSPDSAWQPKLQPGVLPAYDEALIFLSSHSSSLQSRIASLSSTHPDLSPDSLAELKESLLIAASISDPATLASFQSSSPTHYDASNPAFRHLRERLWRKDSGVLAKVMERCQLMKVLPDVLPAITPSVDVQLAFGEGEGFTDHESSGGDVLVGAFVPVERSVQPPQVCCNVFHTEPKKYTLAIVDPDQPNEEEQTFKTTLVALKTDITLSATTSPEIDLKGDMVVGYIPPHPQQGTPYHRYTTLLFEQNGTIDTKGIDREEFNVRHFAEVNGLKAAGVHFWRAKWTPEGADTVSGIYRDVLKRDEPKYTKPPTLDKVRKQVGDLGSKWFS